MIVRVELSTMSDCIVTSVLYTVTISGEDVCCSVVFGTLVGVFVFSVMWSELLSVQSSYISYFRYKKCDIIPEYIRYVSPHNKYHLNYGIIFFPPPLHILDMVQ